MVQAVSVRHAAVKNQLQDARRILHVAQRRRACSACLTAWIRSCAGQLAGASDAHLRRDVPQVLVARHLPARAGLGAVPRGPRGPWAGRLSHLGLSVDSTASTDGGAPPARTAAVAASASTGEYAAPARTARTPAATAVK
eukprot:scaffold106832_cov68-Phaeocystis_antarctica.AAC.3